MIEIDRLGQIVPPQEKCGSAADWSRVEVELGYALPTDYMRFVELYGAAPLCDAALLLSPFESNPHRNLFQAGEAQLADLAEIATFRSIPYPFGRNMSVGVGLIPAGVTSNGNVLYWRATGRPDAWRIVVRDARARVWHEHEPGIVRFLLSLLGQPLGPEAVVFAGHQEDSPSRHPQLKLGLVRAD